MSLVLRYSNFFYLKENIFICELLYAEISFKEKNIIKIRNILNSNKLKRILKGETKPNIEMSPKLLLRSLLLYSNVVHNLEIKEVSLNEILTKFFDIDPLIESEKVKYVPFQTADNIITKELIKYKIESLKYYTTIETIREIFYFENDYQKCLNYIIREVNLNEESAVSDDVRDIILKCFINMKKKYKSIKVFVLCYYLLKKIHLVEKEINRKKDLIQNVFEVLFVNLHNHEIFQQLNETKYIELCENLKFQILNILKLLDEKNYEKIFELSTLNLYYLSGFF
jgi:hypothetical protein